MHNVPAFKLKVKTFEYSSEDIDTGIAEIDAIETDNSLDAGLHQVDLWKMVQVQYCLKQDTI